MQRKRAAEVGQEGQQHQVGQARGQSVGDPGAVGGRSVEQIGGITEAGGGGGEGKPSLELVQEIVRFLTRAQVRRI